MKITMNHKKFYLSKKVILSSSIWPSSSLKDKNISIHSLINSQCEKSRLNLANTSKRQLEKRINKAKDKVKLTKGFIKQYEYDRDFDHLIPHLMKILNRLEG